MKLRHLFLLGALVAAPVQANFLEDLAKTIEKTAKKTVNDVAADVTEDLIRSMTVDYRVEQTRTGDDVLVDYREETGTRPLQTIVSSYQCWMTPNGSARPGQEVRIQSVVQVIRGSRGGRVRIEERLSIWDNEDPDSMLTEMTKPLGRGASDGGVPYDGTDPGAVLDQDTSESLRSRCPRVCRRACTRCAWMY